MKIGVFSDAHGVIGAFENACKQLRDAGATKLIYLGDVIGYVPHLGALRSLIESQILSVRGNHEVMLLTAETIERNDEIYQLSYVRNNISEKELVYIESLPEKIIETVEGVKCLFVHGSPSDPLKGYIYPDTDLQSFTQFTEQSDVIFMGHTHRPFNREYNGTMYVNVGSCGLPRDGSRSGTACVFDVSQKKVTFLDLNLTEAANDTLERTASAESVVRYLRFYAGLK